MKFLPYQVRWIQDESPIKVYEKTRRGGITYATSYRACIKCIRSGKKDSTFVQWVTSRDEITAKEFIVDYVAHWAKEANKAAAKSARKRAVQWEGVIGLDGETVEVVDEKRGITARVVKFKNGARIYSLSSNPLTFAGKGGDVLIDEWDLHEDQAGVYDMAFPCTTWGGQLEVVSAYDPEGSEQTEFARLCRDCKNGLKPNISFHRTTIVDAIDEGFVETVNEVKIARGQKPQTREEFLAQIKGGCRTRGAFESQYMCVPNRASGEQLISGSDLLAAQKDIAPLRIHIEGLDELEARGDLRDSTFWRDLLGGGRVEFGWDIAVTGDLTSFFVNRRDGEIRTLAALVTMHKCDRPSRQRAVAEALLDSGYGVVGAGDKSGLGRDAMIELELAYPDRFAGVVFGQNSKLELGTLAASVYEQRWQVLPLCCPEVAADAAGVHKGATPSGKLTFIETKNELLPESHCDIFWSNALAIYAGAKLNSLGPCKLEPCVVPSEERLRRNDFNEPDRMKHHEIPKTTWLV